MADDHTMSFGDHLEELRRRILLALAIPLPLSVLTFLVSNTLITWLVLPLRRAVAEDELAVQLQVLGPPEFLITKIKLSLIAAVIFSLPWVVWQVWLFIRPGLYSEERRFVHFLIPGSAILTAAGVALLYFAMLPLMLSVLLSVGSTMTASAIDREISAIIEQQPTINLVTALPEDADAGTAWFLLPDQHLFVALATDDDDPDAGVVMRFVQPTGRSLVSNDFRLSTYINFVLVLMLGITAAFQMPLVVLLLGWIGIVTPDWLKSQRRYALVVCGVVAAVITPADVISMVAMLAPLYLLYELGILLLIIAPASKVAEGSLLKRGPTGTDGG